MVSLVSDWISAIGGVNLTDNLTGREVVDPVEFEAGGADKYKAMLKHTYNETAGSIIGRYPTEKRLGTPESSAAEILLNLPGIKPLIGSWIKVSDSGTNDIARAAKNDYKQVVQAPNTLMDRDIVKKLYVGERLTDAETKRFAEMNVGNAARKLIAASVRSKNYALAAALFDTSSKGEAEAVVNRFEAKKLMSPEEAATARAWLAE